MRVPLYPVIIVIINNFLQSNAMYKLTNGLDVIQLLKDIMSHQILKVLLFILLY